MKEGKRNKKIDARFTETEYNQVLALEKELGISKTELIRMGVLSNAGKAVVNAKELIIHLDAVGAEMGRIGNNINQLARYANILNLKGHLQPAVAVKFNELFEQYLNVQQAIETALRKIIRAMNK